jgi:3-hydroxyacyl-CoA dehydrogenase
MSTYPNKVEKIAVVGLGTIGMSWTAYFLARGFAVTATDIDPAAEARTRDYVAQSFTSLEELGLVARGAGLNGFTFSNSLEGAIKGADFVQENGPENEGSKTELLAKIDRVAPEYVPIASSTSALRISSLQSQCRYPARCFVGHPFNPPHLIPLVEIVGGSRTDRRVLEWAGWFYREIGREPIHLQREIYGHIANRLQYVLFNEAARLVLDGVASVEDVDRAVSWGPGMRWALFGPFMTMHLGGGSGGMEGSFAKFHERDSTNTDRATRMTLSADQQRVLVDGVAEMSRGRRVEEIARARDEQLVRLYKLKDKDMI